MSDDGQPFVMGIDAGGTKSVCCLADVDGRIVGESRGGGANLQALGYRVDVSKPQGERISNMTLLATGEAIDPARSYVVAGWEPTRLRPILDMALERWLAGRDARVRRFKGTLDEMKLRSEIDFATLSVAAAELRDLISD